MLTSFVLSDANLWKPPSPPLWIVLAPVAAPLTNGVSTPLVVKFWLISGLAGWPVLLARILPPNEVLLMRVLRIDRNGLATVPAPWVE